MKTKKPTKPKTKPANDLDWLLSLIRSITKRPFELRAGPADFGPTIVFRGVDHYLWIEATRIKLRDAAWVRSHLSGFIERNAIDKKAKETT